MGCAAGVAGMQAGNTNPLTRLASDMSLSDGKETKVHMSLIPNTLHAAAELQIRTCSMNDTFPGDE